MPNWKKVITSGSDAHLNSLTINNGNLDLTGSLHVSSSSSSYFVGGGNVGIGISSPEATLHVSGAIYQSGLGYSTFLGYEAGKNDDKSNNYNTAVGHQALYSNTTGVYNTAQGYKSLYTNSGSYNTAQGMSSLFSNTTGNYNTAQGVNSLYANTTGSYNTALGWAPLRSNTTGDYNTATGFQSLYSNTTANNNTAIGYQSLYSNTTGERNTAQGRGSLYSNTSGSYNTAIGYQSLYSNTTGNYNTSVGYRAGRYQSDDSTNPSGSNSVYIGYNTKASGSVDAETNQIVIGSEAIGIGSNTVVLGNDSITTTALKGKVGIGTTTPSQKLTVSGSISASGDVYLSEDAKVGSTTGIQANDDYLHFDGGNRRINHVIDLGNKYSVNINGITIGEDASTPANVGGIFGFTVEGNISASGALYLDGKLYDVNNAAGSSGQVLSSTGTGVDWVDASTVSVNGTGSANYISRWVDGDTLTTSSLYETGSKIGIGTTTPNKALTIEGDISASGDITIDYTKALVWKAANNNIYNRIDSNHASGYYAIRYRSNGGDNDTTSIMHQWFTNKGGVNDTSVMALSRGGLLGIGTTTPNEALTVSGSISASGDLYLDGKLYDVNNGAGTSGQVLSSTGTGIDWIDASTASVDGTGTANYIARWVDGDTITTSSLYETGSKVGIGTTNPDEQLTIVGPQSGYATFTMWGDGGDDSNDGIRLRASNYGSFDISTSKTSGLSGTPGWDSRFIIEGGGNVGIGTTDPQEKFHVEGTIRISSSSLQNTSNPDIASGTTETIASIATSSYTAGFFDFVATSGSAARAGSVMTVWNGSSLEFAETSTQDINDTSNLKLSASLSGGNVLLQGTSITGSWSVKTLIRTL